MIGRFSRLGEYHEIFTRGETLRCLGGGALALTSFLLGQSWREASPLVLGLALTAAALNGLPIIWNAARGLIRRHVNVDELVALAVTASLIQGEFLTAAVVSFIMALGSLVEEAVSDSARRSIKALARMTPDEATRLTPEGARTVRVAEVRRGDRLLVRPGERIPVDGVIVAGSTAVDESSVTGESIPRERGVGEPVLAASLNYTGVIEIVADRVGEDTTLGRVMRLVEEAEMFKPRAARIVDRYARWFTPLVLALAGGAWLFSGDASRAVAVLVAGCPCALLLAAPTASVAAVARAARSGVLVKGGAQMEAVARADAALFDKTGTLTLGRPRVEGIAPAEGVRRADVLHAAAAVERHCAHPLAGAVLRAAEEEGVDAPEAVNVSMAAGLGVRGDLPAGPGIPAHRVEVGGPRLIERTQLPPELSSALAGMRRCGATALLALENGRPLGLLAVGDTPRPEAAAALAELRRLGIAHVGVLSGDEAGAVDSVCAGLGLRETWSGLVPGGKLEVIADWQRRGRRVLYAGDGVNDAPALARADAGIAMAGAGADVALETAGIALTRDDLGRLPFLVRLSRRMLRLVAVNLGLGLFSNAIAVYGGMTGLLSPIAASLLHNIGSVLVVLVSASLLFFNENAGRSGGDSGAAASAPAREVAA